MLYSISNWIYGDESLRDTFARLHRYGYDGIELRGEPRLYDAAEVKALCKEFHLAVLSIAGMYPWPTDSRDLANPDPLVRQRAIDYLHETTDFAVTVGAPLIIVVPSSVAKVQPLGDVSTEDKWEAARAREWQNAVESVRAAAAYAERQGILLAIEPINRYETFLVNSAEQGMRFVKEVDSPAVKLHVDTFHMNIEEKDPADAIRQARDLLVNVHIADSNREAVGRGHTDFRAIVRALNEIGYTRALTLEPLPPVSDPYIAIQMKRYRPLWDVYAEECITQLKAYERGA